MRIDVIVKYVFVEYLMLKDFMRLRMFEVVVWNLIERRLRKIKKRVEYKILEYSSWRILIGSWGCQNYGNERFVEYRILNKVFMYLRMYIAIWLSINKLKKGRELFWF